MTDVDVHQNEVSSGSESGGAREVWYDPAVHRRRFSDLLEGLVEELQNEPVREVLGRHHTLRLRSRQNEILDRLNADFTLAILGSFKRGKSTLINALLGSNVVTTDVAPETVTINEIRYGPQYEVDAYLLDGGRVSLAVDELRSEKLVNILSSLKPGTGTGENQPVPNRKNIVQFLSESFQADQLRRICFESTRFYQFRKELPDAASVNQIVYALVEYAEQHLLLEELLDWAKIENPSRYPLYEPYVQAAVASPAPVLQEPAPTGRVHSIEERLDDLQSRISHLSIRVPVDWLQGIRLIDTPGLGDTNGRFDRQVQAYLPKADAVVFLVTPNSPLSASERAFLQRSVLPRDFPKIFFVVNCLDQLSQLDEERVLGLVRKRLSALFPDAPVYGLSALCEIDPQHPLHNQQPGRATAMAERFQNFRKGLNESILLNRDLIQLDRAIVQAGQLLDDLERDVQRLKRVLEVDQKQLHASIAQCEDQNSELNQLILQHKQHACQKIEELRQQATLWMTDFANRIAAETIPSLAGLRFEEVQRHFHFFISDAIHQAIRSCVDQHAPLIHEYVQQARVAVQSDFNRLVEGTLIEAYAPTDINVSIPDVSLNNLDALDMLIDQSLVTLFGIADSLSLVVVGLLQQRKSQQEPKRISEYQDRLRGSLPEMIVQMESNVSQIYDEVTRNVEQQIDSIFAQQAAASLAALNHVKSLQNQKVPKVSNIQQGMETILQLVARKRNEFADLRSAVWPGAGSVETIETLDERGARP